MPYKVVLTIEKGKSVLTSVPESWEKDGILFWPPKNTTEKIKQGAYPKDYWKSINCVVKRKNIDTFENAEEEIDRMCEHSDTEYIETADEMPPKKRLKKKKAKMCISSIQPDFNDQAQECIKNFGNQTNSEKCMTESHKNDESTSSPLEPLAITQTNSQPIEVPAKKTTVDLQIINDNEIQTDSFFAEDNNLSENVFLLAQSDETPTNILRETQNLTTKIIDDFSDKLQSVLDNQIILSQNQQNIILELAKLNVRFEEFVKGFSTKDNQVENKLDFKAIANIEDLEELENKLKNIKYKTELEKKFSVICKTSGKGLNAAYKLVDLIFKRDFMTQCSWAGGSRVQEKKNCFKAFQRTIDLFFNMVRATDNTFTFEECETFFKNVMRNSKKRSLMTDSRQSAPKKRPKNIKKIAKNTKEPEKSNGNVPIRDALDDNEEKRSDAVDDEEEEESLL